MLHIFHGDDVVTSRKELLVLVEKHKDKEKLVLAGKNLSLLSLKQALETASLFGGERIVVIEGLLASFARIKTGDTDKKSKDLAPFLEVLLATEHEVVLWEEKEIGKLMLKKFPEHVDRAVFPIHRGLFKFLEQLSPQSTSRLLTSFDNLVKEESVEMIFYMLVRHMRMLLMISQDPKLVSGLAPWQISRLSDQVRRFNPQKLVLLYNRLFAIDRAVKRGETPFTLSFEMKRFLVEL